MNEIANFNINLKIDLKAVPPKQRSELLEFFERAATSGEPIDFEQFAKFTSLKERPIHVSLLDTDVNNDFADNLRFVDFNIELQA